MVRLVAGGPSRKKYAYDNSSSFLLRTSTRAVNSPSGVYGFIGPFGVSVSASGGFGDRNNAGGQTGFQLITRQANLMIDYSFNQKLITGLSFGYLGTDRKLRLNSGSLNSDSYRFAPFLVFRPTVNSYFNLMGGYALVNYDSTRSVAPEVTNATAKYNANQFFASLGGGYTHTLMDGWNLRGYGRGDFSHIDVKGFKENGGQLIDGNEFYAMQVKGQDVRSVTSTLGAELSHAISTKTIAAVIIPRLRAEWVHEFENNGRTVEAGFISISGDIIDATRQNITINSPQRNWANIGFGLQMLFPHAIVGYVNYERLIIKHANNNIISGGVRINF